MTNRPDPLNVVAVCGLGMGSSLILTMTIEAALHKLGINATVSHSDISSAHSSTADVIVGQQMHTDEVSGSAPVIVVIEDFVDDDVLAARLKASLTEKGWM